MRKALVALAVVMLIVTGVVECSGAESSAVTLPVTMKVDYVTGTRTPEAILLEIDWLKDEN